MKKLLLLFLAIAVLTLAACGKEATIEKVDIETPASEVNWLTEKADLTTEEKMVKAFTKEFFVADADLREEAVSNYIHPEVQPLFFLISGFSEDVTPINMDKFVVIESVEHEADGVKGLIVLTREAEAELIHERIFFVYEDKLGWIFSPITEEEDMRETFHELRTRFSAELPPKEMLMTFKASESDDSEDTSQAEAENQVGTRKSPLALGEQVNISYNDLFHGDVELDIELLEVISGEEAWQLVKAGNQFNEAPAADQEYVLAKFHVKVNAVETEPFDLNQAQFDAVSSGGNTYDGFISVSGLDPDLSNELYEGAERVGYTYFLIDKDDDNPLISFNRRNDGEVWFEVR